MNDVSNRKMEVTLILISWSSPWLWILVHPGMLEGFLGMLGSRYALIGMFVFETIGAAAIYRWRNRLSWTLFFLLCVIPSFVLPWIGSFVKGTM